MIYILLGTGFYVFIAAIYFVEWMDFFSEDKDMNIEVRIFSMFILLLATLLWPLIIPFAYRELLKFHKKHKQIITLLLSLPDATVIDTDKLLKKVSRVSKTPDTPIYGFSFKDRH